MEDIDVAALHTFRVCLFIANVTAMLLFGACLTLCVATIRRLHGLQGLPRRTFWTMTSIVVVMVLFFVALVSSVSTLLHALLGLSLEKLPVWPVPTVIGCTAFALGFGDCLFIYRTWIIWGRSRWVCVPVLILLAELATSYYSLVEAAERSPVHVRAGDLVGLRDVSATATAAGTAGIILTIVLNTLLAGAAVTRLLIARRALRSDALPGGGAHYVRISLVLAVSTVVYASVWVPMLAWGNGVRITPYYVVLFALVAAMPLAVMLHVRGIGNDAPFVLPSLEGVEDELQDFPALPSAGNGYVESSAFVSNDKNNLYPSH